MIRRRGLPRRVSATGIQQLHDPVSVLPDRGGAAEYPLRRGAVENRLQPFLHGNKAYLVITSLIGLAAAR
jgi:hypothetical protein